jgi:diaminohydroxyphosphoribosylaminopyrimidine deaminase / 5-amino-6-(5-phosphoribosylamino)uracil reductase
VSVETNDIWLAQEVAFMDMAVNAVSEQLLCLDKYPEAGCVVGCVIVQGSKVVGKGVTSVSGRPHAEANALAVAGTLAFGADVYVTLEPCAHESERGPSCASSLVCAGVRRVIACLQDPDPRTAGAGFARLREAGIICEVGLRAEAGKGLIGEFRNRFDN